MTRAELVAAARASIARGSKSFAAASHLFAPKMRERAWLLYAWCRACDDLADGQDHGHGMTRIDDAPARLARLTALTEAALAGRETGEMPFDALRVVAAETGLPAGFARHHLAGFARDAAEWRPATEAELLDYCYQVAGVVGCMMAVVMGVSPSDETTLDRACELGLAFQLANIARDVAEDASVGRCYLPGDWLAEAGIARKALLADPARLVPLVRRLTDRAAQFEARARHGTPALPFRAAWAVLAAARIYGDIGRKVATLGAGALTQRVSTSRGEKIGAIYTAWHQARRRAQLYPPLDDPPLWARPRL